MHKDFAIIVVHFLLGECNAAVAAEWLISMTWDRSLKSFAPHKINLRVSKYPAEELTGRVVVGVEC